MPVRVVVGCQWGDEGKGKIIDLLCALSRIGVVARFQGGANAGHTVVVKSEKYILHLIPSGILHPNVQCYIGNGVVIEPDKLLYEIDLLESKNFQVRNRLAISTNAHVIMPYHIILDKSKESNPNLFIGTTGRGIGPAYVDKVDRIGIRMMDLQSPDLLREKLALNLKLKASHLKRKKVNLDKILQDYLAYGERLQPCLRDVSRLINEDITAGKNILLEGAQGTLLDVDFGTYPYVTSSSPIAGGACTGLGIGPTKIDDVIGVFKAYTTRVGEGPFPTEFLSYFYTERIREWGKEFGATTGRPRRCGWFDGVLARFAARINGLTEMAITKLDVLDRLATVQICTGYHVDGDCCRDLPTDLAIIRDCQPVYEELPGWQQNTTNIREFDKLPKQAQIYLRRIEELVDVPLRLVSVGSERDQTIWCK